MGKNTEFFRLYLELDVDILGATYVQHVASDQ